MYSIASYLIYNLILSLIYGIFANLGAFIGAMFGSNFILIFSLLGIIITYYLIPSTAYTPNLYTSFFK